MTPVTIKRGSLWEDGQSSSSSGTSASSLYMTVDVGTPLMNNRKGELLPPFQDEATRSVSHGHRNNNSNNNNNNRTATSSSTLNLAAFFLFGMQL